MITHFIRDSVTRRSDSLDGERAVIVVVDLLFLYPSAT